ncbi:MAG: DEAD/DEAH box helicase [Patescibacteria group bacterium]
MGVKGLFIGVDKYQAKSIGWLSCATNDAQALYGLFFDNLGIDLKLLTNEQATKKAIITSLENLQQCEEEDLVFISFSGHGSDTHEIVAYDSDPNKLEETGITIAELVDLFNNIPSKKLVLVLDCCFSGGMGSKAIQIPAKPRTIESVDEKLKKLSGEGRFIFTASLANQKAFENQKVGHGLLTNFLMEAFLGANEIRKNGKIDTYNLLQYVTQRVIDAAKQIGKEQNPTMRGQIDSSFTWPIFNLGDKYLSYFPERGQKQISEELDDLSGYGFSTGLIDVLKQSIPKLNKLQQDAINEYKLFRGDHLVVSAPTSSGKTFIGELAILNGVINRKRGVFLLPMRALVNDKDQEFKQRYEPYGLKIIQATGETNDEMPDFIRGRYDICLMTFEKFASVILTFPHVLENIGVIVVDEVQMITDKSRGINLEFIITLIKSKRQFGVEPQLVALSAVIGDTHGFENWLGGRILKREERPVPLDEGLISPEGSYVFIDPSTKEEIIEQRFIVPEFRKSNSSQNYIIPLVRKLITEGKQVIVFREKKGEARGTANYLAGELNLPSADDILNQLPQGDNYINLDALKNCLKGGVAFHTADLDKDSRLAIEKGFRQANSKIRVIAATTTLAMGINTPADSVIVAGLTHPGISPIPYSVAEYKNIIGRAGRFGIKNHGQSFIIALSSQDKFNYWKDYVLAKPEPLESRFHDDRTDPRTLIVRVLVTANRTTNDNLVGMTADEIYRFIEYSFGSYLKAQEDASWKLDNLLVMDALINLEAHDLVKRNKNDKYQLTDIGWLCGQGGIEVESVTRLVDIVRPLDVSNLTEASLVVATQITKELDNVFITVNSKGAEKEKKSWYVELQNQNVPTYLLDKLVSKSLNAYQAASRLKKAAACLLWVSGLPMNEVENILTRHGGKFDGASGAVRSISSRTSDLLSITFQVAKLLHSDFSEEERIKNLICRLETGSPASTVEIAKVLGSKISRYNYLSLAVNGLCTLNAVDQAKDEDILKCVDNSRLKLVEARQAVQKSKEDSISEDYILPSIPKYEF